MRFDKPLPPLAVPAGAPVEVTYLAPLSGSGNVVASLWDTKSPTAPTALTATSGPGSVSLAWGTAFDNVGVAAYKVERCPRGLLLLDCALLSPFVEVASVPGLTFVDSGVAAAQAYSYRVRAADAAKNLSPYSNVASATPLAASPPPPPPGPIESSSGTVITTVGGGPIIDRTLALWTFAPKDPTVEGGVELVVKRNGLTMGAGVKICYAGGSVNVFSTGTWYRYSPGVWTNIGATNPAGC
jgi:hypothetical protein